MKCSVDEGLQFDGTQFITSLPLNIYCLGCTISVGIKWNGPPSLTSQRIYEDPT